MSLSALGRSTGCCNARFQAGCKAAPAHVHRNIFVHARDVRASCVAAGQPRLSFQTGLAKDSPVFRQCREGHADKPLSCCAPHMHTLRGSAAPCNPGSEADFGNSSWRPSLLC
eukprot:364088-Chlamydomonas_euryale.AAC.8